MDAWGGRPLKVSRRLPWWALLSERSCRQMVMDNGRSGHRSRRRSTAHVYRCPCRQLPHSVEFRQSAQPLRLFPCPFYFVAPRGSRLHAACRCRNTCLTRCSRKALRSVQRPCDVRDLYGLRTPSRKNQVAMSSHCHHSGNLGFCCPFQDWIDFVPKRLDRYAYNIASDAMRTERSLYVLSNGISTSSDLSLPTSLAHSNGKFSR